MNGKELRGFSHYPILTKMAELEVSRKLEN